jgi:trehalose-6-phosphatase
MKVVYLKTTLIVGTLVAWASGPGIVLTTQPKVVSSLNDLAADPRNIVYVMSGETTSVTSQFDGSNSRCWINYLDRVRILV